MLCWILLFLFVRYIVLLFFWYIINEGRPKLTWVEEIRGLMEGKGLMEEDWNDRANNFYIVLYKFYIVELLLSQMRCHVTSIICTKSYLILQFCDGGFMMACLDRNISSVTHE